MLSAAMWIAAQFPHGRIRHVPLATRKNDRQPPHSEPWRQLRSKYIESSIPERAQVVLDPAKDTAHGLGAKSDGGGAGANAVAQPGQLEGSRTARERASKQAAAIEPGGAACPRRSGARPRRGSEVNREFITV
jgi:hypothetical protein